MATQEERAQVRRRVIEAQNEAMANDGGKIKLTQHELAILIQNNLDDVMKLIDGSSIAYHRKGQIRWLLGDSQRIAEAMETWAGARETDRLCDRCKAEIDDDDAGDEPTPEQMGQIADETEVRVYGFDAVAQARGYFRQETRQGVLVEAPGTLWQEGN
jgi:hypothetical protein